LLFDGVSKATNRDRLCFQGSISQLYWLASCSHQDCFFSLDGCLSNATVKGRPEITHLLRL